MAVEGNEFYNMRRSEYHYTKTMNTTHWDGKRVLFVYTRGVVLFAFMYEFQALINYFELTL